MIDISVQKLLNNTKFFFLKKNDLGVCEEYKILPGIFIF
jgi:hypothetical protein